MSKVSKRTSKSVSQPTLKAVAGSVNLLHNSISELEERFSTAIHELQLQRADNLQQKADHIKSELVSKFEIFANSLDVRFSNNSKALNDSIQSFIEAQNKQLNHYNDADQLSIQKFRDEQLAIQRQANQDQLEHFNRHTSYQNVYITEVRKQNDILTSLNYNIEALSKAVCEVIAKNS
jgi:hypothetical protein